MCNFNNNKETPIELLSISSSPVESLNVINRFFCSVGRTLASQLLDAMNTSEHILAYKAKTSHAPVNSMAFSHIDPIEVKKTVDNLKSNTAPGWDKINTNLIKQNINILAYPICYLCNLSLESGICQAF